MFVSILATHVHTHTHMRAHTHTCTHLLRLLTWSIYTANYVLGPCLQNSKEALASETESLHMDAVI